MTCMEVITLVSDPPVFPEIRQGWYCIDNQWWLTWDALQTEFNTTGKTIAEITLTTRKDGANEGRLRTVVRFNKYSDRGFVLYNLDDMNTLFKERLKQGFLLQQDKSEAT